MISDLPPDAITWGGLLPVLTYAELEAEARAAAEADPIARLEWDRMSEEERRRAIRDSAAWRAGVEESARRAGFASIAAHLDVVDPLSEKAEPPHSFPEPEDRGTAIPALATREDVLAEVGAALERSGVAGEARLVKLTYLVITTRVFDRPVSMVAKGPSAGGKSYILERVLRLFPDSAWYAVSAMSDHALVYAFDDVNLVHRMLVVYEAAGLASEVASYLIRSLLSEGHLKYITVVKGKDGMRGRTIDRPGPTGLITTTTAVHLHPENETRMLSLTVTDSPDQTRAVMLAHADVADADIDVRPWHELQEWLAGRPCEVTVPYARTLAEAIPPVAVRLRRDFATIMTLIRAHALLHQGHRERDHERRVVASIADYGAVRELVGDLVADAVERTVPATVRDTVRAVAEITLGKAETTTVAVATALGIDKSAAWRRCQVAIDRGYVKNLEDKPRRPARLTLGDSLPDDVAVLPAPEALERLHDCASLSGGYMDEAPEPSAIAPVEVGSCITPTNDRAIVQSESHQSHRGQQEAAPLPDPAVATVPANQLGRKLTAPSYPDSGHIVCTDYHAHQSAHRWTGAAWACDACAPLEKRP